VPSQVRIPAYVEPLLPPDVVHSPLVARARERDLTADQVRRLATELQRSPTPDQVRHNLVALLYAGDASQRDAVEPHLDAADPEIRRLSLLVLCAGWRLTRDHLARLARLIEGDDPALRRTAVTIAATFLSTRRSRQLLELLLSIVADHGRPQAIRDEALAALHLATDGFPGGLQDHLSDQDAAHALDSARVRLASE